MNEKTLNHLNKLWALSKVIVLGENFTISEHLEQTEKLWPKLQECVQKYDAEMVRQEIVNAAKEKRHGYICAPTYSYRDAQLNRSIPWEATLRQWILARKEIDAIIDADNKRRADEYETYRIACEQGVAIPPMG